MEVYAIPNYECTLSCPHCEIRSMRCKWDKERFLSALRSLPDNAQVVLFGGEPTLFSDRLEACWKTGKITSISTNLLSLSYDAWKVLLDRKISIATSWNPVRFTESLPESRWLENLKALAAMKRDCMVLVTMTEDLIADNMWDSVLAAFDRIDSTGACSKLLLEHLVDDHMLPDLFQRCDAWLCKLHDAWRWKFTNKLEEKLKQGWKFICNDSWTLHPDGHMTKGCPHGKRRTLCKACLTCKRAAECKPCQLQKACTYPEQLAQRLLIT